MHARERERGWWTRREEEKTANGQHQRGGGATPKATATPVLALGVCGKCVCGKCGVCVDGVVTNGNHHCGTVAVVVCVMGLSGGGGSGKACQTNNTPWCVWWWMWRVWWQARRVGGVAWQPHSAHTPTTNHHHGAHHQSLCVCGTRGVVVVTTTPKQPGKRHACACAVCVMAHESRWMSTRTPTSVCGGCVGSEATSV